MVRVADFAGTFVFALEGAVAGFAGGLDPVGVLVLAFATGLGGGIIRDVVIGAIPPAAVTEPAYGVIVLVAALLAWGAAGVLPVPPPLLVGLDATGLALFAVVGTEKALDRGIPSLPAICLGAVGGVGGGTIADMLLNQVPRVLRVDIYATAALAAGVVVVLGRVARLPRGVAALAAALACIGLRVAAWAYQWQLPHRP